MLWGVSLLITTNKNTTRPHALVPKLRRDEWYSHFSWSFAYCIVWTSIVLVVSRLMEYTVELKRGGGCSNALFSFIYLFQAFIFIFLRSVHSWSTESQLYPRVSPEIVMEKKVRWAQWWARLLWLFPAALILFPTLEPILAAIGPYPGQVAGLLQG